MPRKGKLVDCNALNNSKSGSGRMAGTDLIERAIVSLHPGRDLILINADGFLRSLSVGLIGVVLYIYLFRVGLSSVVIGVVIGAGLAGTALATLMAGLVADRLGRRRFPLVLSLLSAIGGLALAVTPHLPPAASYLSPFAAW
jgi:MFS family permease